MLTLWNKFFHSPWFLLAIFAIGLILVSLATFPLVRASFNDFWSTQNQPIFPLAADVYLQKISRQPQILGDFTQLPIDQEPTILANDLLDYSNLENWFTNQPSIDHQQTQTEYILEIPQLKIFNAVVKVGGVDIDNNLIQFNSDVEIGDFGTPVIFGHSTLRQFYNPKESNKKRYKSIFSLIMTLKKDDLIYIKQGTLTYTYKVTEKKEVPPDDPYILAQNSQVRQLKLVTCTPEGTFIRRGVITAELML